jgi:putative salt-induced outer membrane protein YdiY
MNKFPLRIMCIVVILLTAGGVSADVVTLSDGSRLVGTITHMADGKLVMKTSFNDALELKAELIVSIETDKPVNVEQLDGRELKGNVKWDDAQEKAIISTDSGEVGLPLADLVMIWPEGTKSPKELAAEKAAEKAKPKWGFTAELGAVAKEGNTEEVTIRGGLALTRTWPDNTLKFWGSGEYGETNDIRDTAEAKAGIDYEHNFTKRLFGFAKTEGEYDEFENLDFRSVSAAGLGYYWFREKTFELKNRVGPGYQYERFRDGRTKDNGILDVGLIAKWDITDWLTFTHDTVYYPTFKELRDYRIVSDSALSVPLGDGRQWRLKIGALFEYDALPDPGTEALDETYYTSIVFDIK